MIEATPDGGQAVRQSPHDVDRKCRVRAESATKSSGKSLLVAVREAAAMMDISERSFHALRNEPWMPRAVELRPRMPRWVRSELEEAIVLRAARQTAAKSEPAQLAAGRAKKKSRAAQRAQGRAE